MHCYTTHAIRITGNGDGNREDYQTAAGNVVRKTPSSLRLLTVAAPSRPPRPRCHHPAGSSDHRGPIAGSETGVATGHDASGACSSNAAASQPLRLVLLLLLTMMLHLLYLLLLRALRLVSLLLPPLLLTIVATAHKSF